jgi:hypothetical protein
MSVFLLGVSIVITHPGRQSTSNATAYVSLSSLFLSIIFMYCERFLNLENLVTIIIYISE